MVDMWDQIILIITLKKKHYIELKYYKKLRHYKELRYLKLEYFKNEGTIKKNQTGIFHVKMARVFNY